MKYLCPISTILSAIGAINWGLLAIADFDLVAFIFGYMTTASRIVYGIVGISGIILLSGFFKKCSQQNNV